LIFLIERFRKIEINSEKIIFNFPCFLKHDILFSSILWNWMEGNRLHC